MTLLSVSGLLRKSAATPATQVSVRPGVGPRRWSGLEVTPLLLIFSGNRRLHQPPETQTSPGEQPSKPRLRPGPVDQSDSSHGTSLLVFYEVLLNPEEIL